MSEPLYETNPHADDRMACRPCAFCNHCDEHADPFCRCPECSCEHAGNLTGRGVALGRYGHRVSDATTSCACGCGAMTHYEWPMTYRGSE